METRNTRQLEIILEIMNKKENMFHPTAGEIVELVLKHDPSIGQATVYRNINKLVNDGLLLKIPTDNNFRYDVTTKGHGHLTCLKCHKVFDLFDEDYQDSINSIEKKHNVKVTSSNLVLKGYCEICNKEL